MHLQQYVHFSLTSRYVPASEIAARLGLEPDEVAVRGGRLADPVTPPAHAWTVTCQEPGSSLGAQLARIVRRLAPHLDEIIALSGELSVADPEFGGACLEVVNYLSTAPDTEDDEQPEPQWPLGPLDQDPLWIWSMEREVLQFLLLTTPAIDPSVYG